MKMPVTMGLTVEALESVLGYRIVQLENARVACGNQVYIDLVIDANKEELENEQVH